MVFDFTNLFEAGKPSCALCRSNFESTRHSQEARLISGTNLCVSRLYHTARHHRVSPRYGVSYLHQSPFRSPDRPAERPLVALYREYGVSTAAVLTAWNPWNQPKSSAENEVAQTALISKIDALLLRHWPGHGADPMGKWPPEQSRLVLGLDLNTDIFLQTASTRTESWGLRRTLFQRYS